MSDPHGPDGPEGPGAPDVGSVGSVGSVGEEAAKLLGALSEWAQESHDVGGGLGATVTGLAGHAAARLADVNEHLATGSAECTFCPVCRTIHAVRQTSPEVRAHLASAATSLLQALTGALATVPPPATPGGSRSQDAGADFERIDLDGDDDDGGDDTRHRETDDDRDDRDDRDD